MQFLFPVITDAIAMAGIDRRDIGFTCAGSCDYLSGQTFAFVSNLEAVGAWPPISESHVEMDGAWAHVRGVGAAPARRHRPRARVRLGQELAGRSGRRSIRSRWTRTRSPRSAPTRCRSPRCRPGRCSTRAGSPSGTWPRSSPATVGDAMSNPYAQVSGDIDVDELLQEPYVTAPLRAHDLPPISDGASAVIMATADKARELTEHPVWIRGIDHRIEVHQPGMRDLRVASRRQLAGKNAGVGDGAGRRRRAVGRRSRHQEKILTRGARASATASRSTRRAVRSRRTR